MKSAPGKWSRALRVALLSYWFPRGMGYIVNMLPRYLARLGVDVHYITMDMPHYFFKNAQENPYANFKQLKTMSPGQEEMYEDFRLHCLKHRQVAGHPRFVGLGEKLASIQPDVVQSFLSIGWVAVDAAVLKPRLAYKLFTAAHTTASVFPLANRESLWVEPARIKNFFSRWVSGRFVSTRTEKCYAATSDCADVAIRFFGVQREKVAVAPLGVDTDLLSPISTPEQQQERAMVRERLGVQPQEILYIYTGQFTEAKNPLLLARTVESMRARGAAVRALFLGDGQQRAAIAAHGASIVLPFVPHRELVDYYRAADVGVWPTQESTSMLDAAACGLPVVVNNTLRAVERIDGNGLTYQLNDQASLESVLSMLLDRDARCQLGSVGARRMIEQFSWNALVQRRLSDYRASLEPGASAGQRK
jgi:glycosyltransferase involved in cell wall biosynthesis